MKQYHDLLQDVLDNGVDYDDRTGVGVRSVFGRQSRYDLTQGFPLLTTKKTHMKSIVHELLWFLKGDTNVKYLQDNGVRIWDSWLDNYGTIGKGYGYQWRNWNQVDFVKPRKTSFSVTGVSGSENNKVLGIAEGCDFINDQNRHYYNIWSEMIHRCYNPKKSHYKWYGAKGVRVCDRWLRFSNFYQDISKIENYENKKIDLDNYSLDKDYYGSEVYSPDTCIWLSKEEQTLNAGRTSITKITMPDGEVKFESDLVSFCKMYLLDYSTARKCVRGERESHKNFKFEKVENNSEYLVRVRKHDQIRKIISQIKNDPKSRRIILSAWNVGDLAKMELPPCHCFVQFKVYKDELSCQLYQRSADLFLGVPFNIASYALLTHMLAQVTGLKAKEFVHTLGDAHIYHNHFDQTKELLSRDPNKYTLPTLKLNTEVKDIFDFKYEDIEVAGYESYPTIKAKVAV